MPRTRKRKRSALTPAEVQERVARMTQTSVQTLSGSIHRYVDQADPAQAQRGLRFVCEAGLFQGGFVAFLDAELLAMRTRLQQEGILDAEGWPTPATGWRHGLPWPGSLVSGARG